MATCCGYSLELPRQGDSMGTQSTTYNICFYGELTKIILQLSSKTLLICFSLFGHMNGKTQLFKFQDNLGSLSGCLNFFLLVSSHTMKPDYRVDVVVDTVLCIVSLVPCDILLYTFFMQKLCSREIHTWYFSSCEILEDFLWNLPRVTIILSSGTDKMGIWWYLGDNFAYFSTNTYVVGAH